MSDPWESLHTTALLGTDRRPLPQPTGESPAHRAVDRTDPATALLELAALETVRRRAGALPSPVTEPLAAPAPEDDRPELPAPAARRLSLLLGTRGGGTTSPTSPSCSPSGSPPPAPAATARPPSSSRRCSTPPAPAASCAPTRSPWPARSAAGSRPATPTGASCCAPPPGSPRKRPAPATTASGTKASSPSASPT